MTENSSLILNTPKKNNSIANNKEKPFTDQNVLKQANISIASTEINSNQKKEVVKNLSPKKKYSKIEAIKTFCRIRLIKGTNQLFSI